MFFVMLPPIPSRDTHAGDFCDFSGVIIIKQRTNQNDSIIHEDHQKLLHPWENIKNNLTQKTFWTLVGWQKLWVGRWEKKCPNEGKTSTAVEDHFTGHLMSFVWLLELQIKKYPESNTHALGKNSRFQFTLIA